MRILLAGSSGMIGTEVQRQLHASDHTFTRLVRQSPTGPTEVRWSPKSGTLEPNVLDGYDAIINLAGSSINQIPWTASRKRDILHSRISATRTLVHALERSEHAPAVLVNGSAVGFYGNRPGQVLDEESGQGRGFLARVVYDWERTAHEAPARVRVVTARTGLVIGQGGAMKPLLPLARLGLLGPLGGGRQRWPWVSLRDEAAALIHLATTSTLNGPVNLVGPVSASSRQVLADLARVVHRPYGLPFPRFAVEALLGDAGRELILADQNVVPRRLTDDGFTFRDRTVADAMDALALNL